MSKTQKQLKILTFAVATKNLKYYKHLMLCCDSYNEQPQVRLELQANQILSLQKLGPCPTFDRTSSHRRRSRDIPRGEKHFSKKFRRTRIFGCESFRLFDIPAACSCSSQNVKFLSGCKCCTHWRSTLRKRNRGNIYTNYTKKVKIKLWNH